LLHDRICPFVGDLRRDLLRLDQDFVFYRGQGDFYGLCEYATGSVDLPIEQNDKMREQRPGKGKDKIPVLNRSIECVAVIG